MAAEVTSKRTRYTTLAGLVHDSTIGLWFHYLAERGYVIFMVDNRGTGGRGREFKKQAHRRLGELEVRDQIEGARYLAPKNFLGQSGFALLDHLSHANDGNELRLERSLQLRVDGVAVMHKLCDCILQCCDVRHVTGEANPLPIS